MKLLSKLLNPSRDSLAPAPGQPVRFSDCGVQTGDIISAGEFDASWHVVTAVGCPVKTWDDDLQFYRNSYPYQARVATLEDIEAATGLTGKMG